MLPTFTGKSGRTRQVNLSGQQHANPWAAGSWSASHAGPPPSVVAAQAERQRREREKRKLKAAADIQRIWRARCVRLELRRARRRALDELYAPAAPATAPAERARRALPLLLASFDPKSEEDRRRLVGFAEDVLAAGYEVIGSSEVGPARLKAFVEILVLALDSEATRGEQQTTITVPILRVLCRVVTASPKAVSSSLGAYYGILARLCEDQNLPPEFSELVLASVLAPAAPSAPIAVYEALASSFLTKPNLPVEEKIERLASGLDPEKLATAITKIYKTRSMADRSRAELLWLLAHFIGLYKSWGSASRSVTVLKALYIQLSSLETDIGVRLSEYEAHKSKSRFADRMDIDDYTLETMPPYVAEQLTSLVNPDGLSWLLKELAANLGTSPSQNYENGSLLAGYILTLIRCFPRHSDDIRMRLFLSDIPSPEGPLPAIKFLWLSVNHTKIYREILTNPSSPVTLIRTYLEHSTASPERSTQEQEWRAILLFLELYIFILRLSDDEDFFSGIHPDLLQQNTSTSRIRSCSLSMADVKSLTIFLKNSAFALYYNTSEILASPSMAQASASYRLDAPSPEGSPNSQSQSPTKSGLTTGAYSGVATSKLDLSGLRDIISTALKMLYERDSRRPFLPQKHWLMTSKFDMEGFINAVVTEEQRQHELGEDDDDQSSDGEGEDWDLPQIHSFALGRLSRHARIETMRTMQRKAQREKMLATIGPKLEVLRNMPFVIPFDTRVQIFRQFVLQDKYRRREGNIDPDGWRFSVMNGAMHNPPQRGLASHSGRIRRGEVFNDAYEQFYHLGDSLKEPIQITFVDQFDAEEAGIDGGGVTKEFLTSVTSEAFGQTDELAFFTASSQGLLYPNPTVLDVRRELMTQAGLDPASEGWKEEIQEVLRRFEFLGRIVGKCMYEGILVDIAFAGFFLLKWPSGQSGGENTYRGNVNDLRDMDEELYQGMLRLKNYDGNVADLSLDFTISDQVSVPGEPVRTVTRNLVPNGDQVFVTNDNRLLYISYVARHRLVVQPAQQTAAFLKGLRSIVHPSWLSMFNQTELQRLVGGDSGEIDVEDLRRHTVYSGLYAVGDDGAEHPTVRLFWRVVGGFDDAQRRDLLRYVTSTPRAPLLGFAQLSPAFSIRDGGADEERLPSTSTCVNLLKLPQYRDEETLRSKLLYAISSGAGFDLS